ncbi:response regulator transcription factor [Novosphingobium organovorum]|uniref:response regulator transcription factor n=1 Tax=Novosphingobium organovorum TaxID=2930092 RepID=UPI0038995C2A
MKRSDRLYWLSKRQRQCLALVERGMSSKEIARHLQIAPSTVDNHIKLALARLNCYTRQQAASLLHEERRSASRTQPLPSLARR